MNDRVRSTDKARVAAVIIGRNEAERLGRCIESVSSAVDHIVYVDSGSTDGSIDLARSLGADTVALDPAGGFTAARARNAGFAHLRSLASDIDHVQFVDGDCELTPGWLETATAVLRRFPDAAVVCGRRRERAPHASIYNRLCDVEWNSPVGEVAACGGDALMRAAPFDAVDGFSDRLIAGEEAELCERLRAAGWRIFRIAHDMTLHDAAMYRFSQWWHRNRRSGYATAEAFERHGARNLGLARQVVSNLAWAFPLAWPAWPILWWRIARRRGGLYATFTVLGKLPHAQGQFLYWRRRLTRSRQALIEYK